MLFSKTNPNIVIQGAIFCTFETGGERQKYVDVVETAVATIENDERVYSQLGSVAKFFLRTKIRNNLESLCGTDAMSAFPNLPAQENTVLTMYEKNNKLLQNDEPIPRLHNGNTYFPGALGPWE